MPEWLDALGRGAAEVGKFAVALPLNILGGVAAYHGINIPQKADPEKEKQWHALAFSAIPETLDPQEQQVRTRLFNLTPRNKWPDLVTYYRKLDEEGPQRDLARRNALDGLDFGADAGPQGLRDRRQMAGVGQSLDERVEEQQRLDQARGQREHLPVFGAPSAAGGPPSAAGMPMFPAGPGAAPPGPALAPPSAPATGGAVRYFDLGPKAKPRYALEDGTLLDTPPSAAPGIPADTVRADGPAATAPAPVATPLSGRPIEERFPPVAILPGETPVSFAQRQKARDSDIQLSLSGDQEAQKSAQKRQLDREALAAAVREDQAYMGTVFGQLEPLINDKALPQRENFPSGPGGIARDLLYQGKQLTHTRNAYPDQAKLMRLANGVLGQISRRFSGEKGVLTDKDVEVRARPLVPDERDTQETAREKVAGLKAFGQELAARRLDPNWQPPEGEQRIGEDGDAIDTASKAAPAATFSREELEAEARRRGLR